MAQMSQPATAAGTHAGTAYANYALGLLTVVVLLNFLDRQIIAILAEPIKQDLGLTDAQVGLMAGLSFAILYTTLGIPIAWLADRWNRSWIIAISLAIWSGMTVLCGFAAGFWQLFLARVGVGIGEAGSGPASHSLIADLFAPEKRAGAFGVFGLGIPVGAFIAYGGGGWIVENFSWREAFIAAGLPGLIVALIVFFTLKEPRKTTGPRPDGLPLKAALKELASKPTYWHLIVGATLVAFVAYGLAAFYGAFFVRIHAMGYAQLGLVLGALIGVSGALGAWLGGQTADYFGKRAVGGSLVAPGIVLIAAAPLFAYALYTDNKWVAILCLGAPTFAATFYYGPTFANVQGLARPESRAMAAAIFVFVTSLVGMGLGPVFSGALSDHFAASQFDALGLEVGFGEACAKGGPEEFASTCREVEAGGLRQSILILSLFNLWAAAHFLIAARTLRRDLTPAT